MTEIDSGLKYTQGLFFFYSERNMCSFEIVKEEASYDQ